MGCYSQGIAEVYNKLTGKWEKVGDVFDDFKYDGQIPKPLKTDKPFFWQDYDVYAFLANVRNRAGLTPICEPKGLPEDSEYLNSEGPHQSFFGPADPVKVDILGRGNHSHTWLTLRELLDFNYENDFVDKSDNTVKSYREALGQRFFEELAALSKLGQPEDVRIIIWFD